jgi:pimeloyl-ACP methyl ester carboxylesterase
MAQYKLTDNRSLEVLGNDVASNQALVLHHGTPGDATLWAGWLDHCAQRGLRALAISRPGYGASSRRRGRRVVDINDDVNQVLEQLGISEVVAIGWSGGGPHAIANGLDIRCQGVITLAGVAAYGQQDIDFLAGMGPENHEEFGAAILGDDAINAWMERNAAGLRNVTGPQLRDAFGGLVGEVDRAVINGRFADDLAATMRHSLSQGYDGWVDDDLAFVKPWDVPFEQITCPVQIWQGDQDLMVPSAHSNWLDRKIATGHLNFVAGHGHLSLIEEYRDAILDQAARMLSDRATAVRAA